MKKILKILMSIIIVLCIITIYLSYIIENNTQFLSSKIKKIQNHYQSKEKITYYNQYGNYYIIKTENNAIVLTKDYKEVAKEELSKLNKEKEQLDLIYKTNKLMYEEKKIKNTKVIYTYYDAKSGEKVKSTTLELK